MENTKPPVSQTPSVQVKNVYQKLALIRAELVKRQIKKSGKNTYSNFTYYELTDFLPHINELNNEVGVMTRFNIIPKTEYSQEKAILEIINVDKPEDKVVFESETQNVEIGKKRDGSGGAEAIQNLGGKITYMKRYLMMNAYEIGEADMVDATKEVKSNPNELSLNVDQIKYIMTSKDLKELFPRTNELKMKLGQQYFKSIAIHYNKRKGEIE
jgi:hypothetical protein